MRILARIRSFGRAFLQGRRFDRDLREEFESHMALRIEDLMGSGLSRQEAQRRARIEFGSLPRASEESREARGLWWIDECLRNFRFGLRVLRRSPVFALGTILTLGLCIGANTSIFSVVDAVLLRPLPLPRSDRLMTVAINFRSPTAEGLQESVDGTTWELIRDYDGLPSKAVFSGLTTGVNLVPGAGRARHVIELRVGAGFFATVGVDPLVGREFLEEEDLVGGPAVTVLSHSLARDLFEDPRAAVGRTVNLRGEPALIVGVMPPGFIVGQSVDAWTPLRPSRSGEGEGANYQVVVRLGDEQSQAVVAEQIRVVGQERIKQMGLPEGTSAEMVLLPLQRGLTEDVRLPLQLLWGAAGLVLLVGCVNVAGLLLARTGWRRREMALRMALGGGRGAVVRQLMVESLLLALGGGVVGIALGFLGIKGLDQLVRESWGLWQTFQLDLRVFSLSAGLSLLTCIFFGLAPAWMASRVAIRPTLAEGGGREGSSGGNHWTRRVLLVAQVSITVILLIGAGLLLRTFANLRSQDPGFDPSGVLSMRVSLHDARYSKELTVNAFFERVTQELSRTSGIDSAGFGLSLPYERSLNLGFRRVGGEKAEEAQLTSVCYISGDFFSTLGIPIEEGRGFSGFDRQDSVPVIVVNRSFAKAYLDGLEAVGTRLQVSGKEREIVGVVGDVPELSSWGNNSVLGAAPTVYLPAAQLTPRFFELVHTWFSPALIVRSQLAEAQVTRYMDAAVASADPHLATFGMGPLQAVMERAWGDQRMQAVLLAAIAGLALLLAAVGLSALVAGTVEERRREIGIRMALGATVGATVRSCASQGVVLVLVGLSVGWLVSWGVTPLLQHLLWGVSPGDFSTFLAAALLLLSIGAVASLVPALRIMRLDPARTLREE